MRAVLVTLAFLALTACGKDKKPGEELIPELAAIKDEMCACPDAGCADKVAAKHKELEERAERVYNKVSELPKDVINQLVPLDAELRACQRKLQTE
jgi:hypothetical protein